MRSILSGLSTAEKLQLLEIIFEAGEHSVEEHGALVVAESRTVADDGAVFVVGPAVYERLALRAAQLRGRNTHH